MTAIPSLIAVLVVLLLCTISRIKPSYSPIYASSTATATAAPADAVELRMAMRKLWEDHISYTRNLIISSLSGLEDAGAVSDRLMKNQDDIGAALDPFYGEDAGAKLSALLKDHIQIAVEVVKAAKAKNDEQLSGAQKKWSSNAKDIAALLNGTNQAWSKKELEPMLQKHLDLTTAEVVARLKKDWSADIKAYDDGHVHMLMFADMLSEGIAKQFPEKFKK